MHGKSNHKINHRGLRVVCEAAPTRVLEWLWKSHQYLHSAASGSFTSYLSIQVWLPVIELSSLLLTCPCHYFDSVVAAHHGAPASPNKCVCSLPLLEWYPWLTCLFFLIHITRGKLQSVHLLNSPTVKVIFIYELKIRQKRHCSRHSPLFS